MQPLAPLIAGLALATSLLAGPGDTEVISSLSFSHDGKWLAVGNEKGWVDIQDGRTGKLIKRLKSQSDDLVMAVRFSPNGKELAAGLGGETVQRWNTADWSELLPLTYPAKGPGQDMTVAVAYSPTGNHLAAAGGPRVEIWALGESPQVRRLTLSEPDNIVYALATHPEDPELAVAGSSGKIALYHPLKQELLDQMAGHEGGTFSLSYRPDGQYLSSGGADKTVKLWRLADRQEAMVLSGHQDSVMSVAWGAMGKRLVSGSEDATVRVWDAQSGKNLNAFKATGPIRAVALSPDGRTLAAGGTGGKVNRWTLIP